MNHRKSFRTLFKRKTHTHTGTSTHTRTLARKRHERGRETEKQDVRERERERVREREEWIEKGTTRSHNNTRHGQHATGHSTDIDTEMLACR